MAQRKRKAVFTAEPEQLEEVDEFVRSGRYRSASEFLREAIGEKLSRLRSERLEVQVARYCAEGYAEDDRDLVEAQAFDNDEV